MKNQKNCYNESVCQSCAMPLNEEERHGTELDGAKSQEYCSFCYQDGKFTMNITMDELIEYCVPLCKDGFGDENEARNAMKEIFPNLKRWS